MRAPWTVAVVDPRDPADNAFDAAAVLLLMISLTGLALWIAMPKRRRAGPMALGLALALAGGVVVAILA